ncbi:AI-2E family transporter [Microvirga rosea]|uniref:AI-2E family transporter n=1 Tax=Microvirga rosea TaxID=2715425 RepID=UPI001D0B94C7|nr:AI-2E family transporter [Microvirga rosea]MCB8821319.1 AI-2E family transporter [Microvirga rosea]
MIALVIAALYVGREVFVPVALAILLSFVLAPLIRLLQKAHVPRALAVVGVVLVAFAGITALATVMATQVTQLAGDLPRYQATMREKVQSLRGSAAGSSALERAADVLQDLGKELDRPQAGTSLPANPLTPSTVPATETKPIPVEVRQPDPGALQTLGAFITPLIHPAATTGIVIIFVIFILLGRIPSSNARLHPACLWRRNFCAPAGHRGSRDLKSRSKLTPRILHDFRSESGDRALGRASLSVPCSRECLLTSQTATFAGMFGCGL